MARSGVGAVAASPLRLSTHTPTKASGRRQLSPFSTSVSSFRFLFEKDIPVRTVTRYLVESPAGFSECSCDPELRSVLELATDEELFELESILYGPRQAFIVSLKKLAFFDCSYFSPLLKSIVSKPSVDYISDEADFQCREDFIQNLESRFFFLAADARSTLRGWRPSYRNVLLGMRKKLKVSCSSKLSTEDLEVEIFLHLLQEYSSPEDSPMAFFFDEAKFLRNSGSVGVGISQWKVQFLTAVRTGAKDFQETVLKGGGILTMSKILQMVARRLTGKVIMEAANYEIKHEIIKRGGQLAAINLESRAALLAARKGLAGAVSRYLGFRNLMIFLGPLFWGTFLAEIVIRSLGTDYARVLRAIYAFAQIRLTRTYGWTSIKK
ncbi:hypothetical protein AXF42_Ash018838 [Apostasia shenzhenica]|uniref:Uncharacterized protein n=1 Tax=Apostasia shenzhenica TaxID=1088818 RepID=A0A2I0B172_9ASPA|nr:hypothetical protein AXF42_Ash018838 [Apostasia shenzhenica]